MTKIAVTGSKGRMGSRVVRLLSADKRISFVAEVDRGDSLDDVIDGVDAVIDFTTPEAAIRHASSAARHKKPIVIGTTGLTEEQDRAIEEAGRLVPIVYTPNMSIGINVMLKLIELAARTLGDKYKVDIVETHHKHKEDRPSGTALKMLDVVCKVSGRCLDKDVFFYEEETPVMPADEDSEVSVRSVRRGEVIGDHVIYFTSPGEILSIEHHATDRDVFAEGAVAASQWIMGKPPGLYSMEDVLGLKTPSG